MANSAPGIIFGPYGIQSRSFEEQEEIFSLLLKHNVTALDTAYSYTDNEETLGKHKAAERFIIHTKAKGFSPTAVTKQDLLDSIDSSLKNLGVESVDLFYLHAPEPRTPIEETLSAIQEIYAAGKFKRFGLSNFPPEDVQKVYDIQAAANSVLPTVFQGNYNAVSRHIEGDLFPVLRKLKISFYAYSPIAGGFLVQDRATLEAKSGERRFDPESFLGKMYLSLYGGKSLFEALDVWADIAKDAGLSKAALAYRWIVHHSTLKKEYGDQVIIGSSRFSQVEETLAAVEAGPLDAAIAKRVDDIWETVKHEAPTDNWKDYAAKTPIQV